MQVSLVVFLMATEVSLLANHCGKSRTEMPDATPVHSVRVVLNFHTIAATSFDNIMQLFK